MGQNLRAVEQIVMNLQNQEIITPEQSECFLQDFQAQNQSLAPVHKFLDNPSLNDYLKYYILCNYSRQQKSSSKSTRRVHSRQEIEAALIQTTQMQIKQRVVKQLKNIQQSVKLALKKVTGLVLMDRISMGNVLIKKLMKDCLKITKFIILVKQNNRFVQYNSSTNHLSTLQSQNSNYAKFTQIFEQCQQTIVSLSSSALLEYSGMRYIFKFTHEMQTYYFTFQIGTDSALIEVLQKEANADQFKRVIMTQMRQIVNSSTQNNQTTSNRLTQICCSSLIIVSLGIKLQQFKTTKYLLSLDHFDNEQNYTIIEVIQKLAHTSQSCGAPFLSQNSVVLVRKQCQKIAKLIKNIEEALILLEEGQNFLMFNRYSDLTFCYVDMSNPLYRRLRSCWVQNRIKIIDILGQHQDVQELVKNVLKNQENNTNQINNQIFTASLLQSNNGVFERLTVTFHKYIRVEKVTEQKEQSVSQSTHKTAKIKHQTSQLQAKMVKDLQKQDPNLKTTGWLKLFVKQSLNTQVRSSKLELKLMVTDIEKIEGIDQHDFNILQLTQEQLVNWIWNIMNMNLTFNSLMKDEENKIRFTNFIEQVKALSTASKNSFHNFHHCVNTLHMCHLLTQDLKVQLYLSSLDIFAVLISGLCHCISHTGFTNAFEIASFSSLALTYNNISPIENSQISKTFQLLKEKKYNFLEPLGRQKFIALKQNVIHNILSTSASEHFKVLQSFKQWTSLPKDQAVTQLNSLTAMIVCASDFAGSCKQFDVSKQWSRRLNLQFANQMQEEKKLGITCSELSVDMDCLKSWAQSQMSYLSVIVSPIYKQICQFFKQSSKLTQIYAALQNNIDQWSKF